MLALGGTTPESLQTYGKRSYGVSTITIIILQLIWTIAALIILVFGYPNRFSEVLESVYHWPLTVWGTSLVFRHVWEMHLTLLLFWLGPLTIIIAFVILVFALVVLMNAGPSQAQDRERAGQDSEKEVSNV